MSTAEQQTYLEVERGSSGLVTTSTSLVRACPDVSAPVSRHVAMNVPSVVTQHTSVLAVDKQRQCVRAIVCDIEVDGQGGWHESKGHNGEGERRSKETRHLRVLGKKGVGVLQPVNALHRSETRAFVLAAHSYSTFGLGRACAGGEQMLPLVAFPPSKGSTGV